MHLYNQVHTFERTVYIGGFGHFSVHDERLNVFECAEHFGRHCVSDVFVKTGHEMFAVMSVGSVPTFGRRHVDAAFSSQEKRAVQKRPRTVNEFHVRFA